MPFLKACGITIWSFLIPVTLMLLVIASFGLMMILAELAEFISMGVLLWGVVCCLICGFIFSFLFHWQRAIEAKRPLADTPITKGMALAAGKETYSKMKALILRRAPKEE